MKISDLSAGMPEDNIGIFADLATLVSTIPPSTSNLGKTALVGSQTQYVEYGSDGTQWQLYAPASVSTTRLLRKRKQTAPVTTGIPGIRRGANDAFAPTLKNTGFVGANISPAYDYSTAQMYVDVIWNARSFALPASPYSYPQDGTIVAVKANGWPAADFSILWGANLASQSTDDGVYEGSFTGTATGITASDSTVSAVVYDAVANISRFQVTATTTTNNPYLTFTGISADFANLRLIRPGYAWNTTQKYSTPWLNLIGQFSYLRTMDITHTSGTVLANYDAASQTTWASRWTPTSTPAGVIIRNRTWEEVIDIGNQTGKDIWICIPHTADDSYITGLATLIKNTLRPDLKCYVEYSNEIWNTGAAYSPQFTYCQTQSRLELDWYGGSTLAADIASATILTNVVTVTFARAHNRTTGQSIKAYLGISGSRVVANTYTVTVVSPTVLTFTVTGTVDGTIALTTNSYIVMNTTSNLAYDFTQWGNVNQYTWGYRYAWRRIAQAKALFDTVFTAGYLLNKIRFIAALQLASSGGLKPTFDFLASNYGPLSTWLYAISGAPYIASGATPATVAAVMAAFTANQAVVKATYVAWVTIAKIYGIKFVSYEGGTDMFMMTNGAVGTAASVDAGMMAQTRDIFLNASAYGVDGIAYYSVGAVKAGIGFDLLTVPNDTVLTSPKLAGVVAAMQAPPQVIDPMYRNEVPSTAAVTTTDWSTSPVYWSPPSASLWGSNGTNKVFNPPAIGSPGNMSPDISYVFYVPETKTYTLTVRAAVSGGPYTVACAVDGVAVTSFALPSASIFAVAATANTPFNIALTAGFHVLRLTGPVTNMQLGFNKLTIA